MYILCIPVLFYFLKTYFTFENETDPREYSFCKKQLMNRNECIQLKAICGFRVGFLGGRWYY